MKLHLKKNQAKKLLGGAKFILEAKLELTDEEKSLVDRYKASEEVIYAIQSDTHKLLHSLSPKDGLNKITIQELTMGKKIQLSNIGEILEAEDAIKEGCKTFKIFLEVMKTFGGEEIFEY